MSDDVPEQYRPRLCLVVKWRDFEGYGFNLHAEKGKSGQFIGKIDKSSPAEAAGLKEGDRIVEVNGVNIGNENHQQVVLRIKSGGEETRLLVVDNEADNWYKTAKKIIRGDSPDVRFISSKRDEDNDTHSDHERENGNDEQIEESHPEPADVEETVTSSISANVYNGSAVINEDHSHRPRLCHLKIWPHFEGYGFNLHAEKNKPGQFIGLVDDNSPSSTGGLKVNDRIIEVNGVNIEQEKHTEVIAMIKAIQGETKLLVVDKETDDYYKDKGITVSSSMPQTEYIVTPAADDVLHGLKSETAHSSEPEHHFTVASTVRQDSSSSSSNSEKAAGNLELNLSVAEMKERLKAKKKQDPRLSKVPFEEKYKEFQRM